MSAGARIAAHWRGSETLRTIGASAAIVVARVVGTAATFAYTLILARLLAPADVGMIWAIWSTSLVAATFATLNIGAVAIREVVRARETGEDAVAAGLIVASRRILLLAGPVVVALFLAVAWARGGAMAEHFTAYLLAALAIPVMGWVGTSAAQATALHMPLRGQAPRELVRPLLFLAALSAMWAAGSEVTVEAVIGLFLAAVVIAAIIQYALVRHGFAFMRAVRPDLAPWRDWVGSALLLAPMRLLADQLKNVVIMTASLAVSAAGVAQIAVALSIVNFLNFGVAAVELGFSAKISRAIVRAERWSADHFLAVSGLLKLLPIVAASALLVVLIEPILSLFGPHYVAASDAALAFLLMPLAKAFFGNSALVLQIAGHRAALFWTSLGALGAMALGVIAAVGLAAGGAAGEAVAAALASALVVALLQAVRWVLCLRATGIDTSALGAAARTISRRLRRGIAKGETA